MKKFTKITSNAVYLPMSNVDTDMIIPKQFLKTIVRTGLGKSLFYELRFDESGNERNDFILNQSSAKESKILISGNNFGCGSSREHAPIALSASGIEAVLALSFARIFYRNSVDGAYLLPIEIDEKTYSSISENDELEIDTSKNEIKNITKNELYSMKPFPDLISKIISAGGIFKYKP